MRDRSIRWQLKAILMAVSASALVAAMGAMVAYDVRDFRKEAAQRLDTLARMVGSQCTAALAFKDPKTGAEILRALENDPSVAEARVETKNGQLFAFYVRKGRDFESEVRLEVTAPVVEAGEHLGTISLKSELLELDALLRRDVTVAGIVLFFALFAAFLLSARLERVITGPVLHLADTVRAVSERGDYSIRARGASGNETGLLIDGFNAMLAQIQERDAALLRARDELELRVQERTVAIRESETRYRHLFESSPDAILIETEGVVSLANPAAASLFGAETPELLLGGALRARVPAERRDALGVRMLGEATFEDTWSRLDGGTVDVEVTVIHLPHRVAQVVIRDITRRKEAERIKNEFISTVSHELRTPLTSIRGSLGLLAAGKLGALPPAARPFVEIASNDCLRLVRLINDLLDIQKIEAGRMDFQMKTQDLVGLVNQAVEANRSYGRQFGVRFVVREVPPTALVRGDGDRLIQVLSNLLSNAAKFSPRGEAVDVSVDHEDGRYLVSVRDRGPGIPAEFRDRIFQKFAQADSSDTRQKGGTGLGLNICKAILEKHEGSISFEAAPGGGTLFRFSLPELAEQPALSSV